MKQYLNKQLQISNMWNLSINNIQNNIHSELLIQLIDDYINKLEAILFSNNTFMFLPRNKAFEGTFKKMNKKTTCGKLLHIKNEYFNKQAIGILQLK